MGGAKLLVLVVGALLLLVVVFTHSSSTGAPVPLARETVAPGVAPPEPIAPLQPSATTPARSSAVVTDAAAAKATKADAELSDADLAKLLGNPEPRFVVPISRVYSAYQRDLRGTLHDHGGNRFSATVEHIQTVTDREFVAFATLYGGKVLAFFSHDDWTGMSKPLEVGQRREFVCVSADTDEMPVLVLQFCDSAD